MNIKGLYNEAYGVMDGKHMWRINKMNINFAVRALATFLTDNLFIKATSWVFSGVGFCNHGNGSVMAWRLFPAWQLMCYFSSIFCRTLTGQDTPLPAVDSRCFTPQLQLA